MNVGLLEVYIGEKTTRYWFRTKVEERQLHKFSSCFDFIHPVLPRSASVPVRLRENEVLNR